MICICRWVQLVSNDYKIIFLCILEDAEFKQIQAWVAHLPNQEPSLFNSISNTNGSCISLQVMLKWQLYCLQQFQENGMLLKEGTGQLATLTHHDISYIIYVLEKTLGAIVLHLPFVGNLFSKCINSKCLPSNSFLQFTYIIIL